MLCSVVAYLALVPVLLSWGFHSLVPMCLQNLYIFNAYEQGRHGRTLNPLCPPEALVWFHGSHTSSWFRCWGGSLGSLFLQAVLHIDWESNEESAIRWEKSLPEAVCAAGRTVAAGKDRPKSGQCRVAAPGWHLAPLLTEFFLLPMFYNNPIPHFTWQSGEFTPFQPDISPIWELLQHKSIPCDKANPALLKVREREFFRSAGECLSGAFFSGCLAVISSHPSTQNNWEVKAQQMSPAARWPELGHYWGVKWIMVWNKPVKTNTLQS